MPGEHLLGEVVHDAPGPMLDDLKKLHQLVGVVSVRRATTWRGTDRPANPSVRSTSRTSDSSDSTTSTRDRSVAASSRVKLRSAALISARRPDARSRPSRRPGSARVQITRCACGGRLRVRTSTWSRTAVSRSTWKSSSRTTMSSGIAARALSMRGSTPVMISPVAASVMSPTSAGTLQPTRSSATARCRHNRPGSLSPGSRDTDAARGFPLAASHCEIRVVLPYPAGAETRVTGTWVASSSRATKSGTVDPVVACRRSVELRVHERVGRRRGGGWAHLRDPSSPCSVVPWFSSHPDNMARTWFTSGSRLSCRAPQHQRRTGIWTMSPSSPGGCLGGQCGRLVGLLRRLRRIAAGSTCWSLPADDRTTTLVSGHRSAAGHVGRGLLPGDCGAAQSCSLWMLQEHEPLAAQRLEQSVQLGLVRQHGVHRGTPQDRSGP